MVERHRKVGKDYKKHVQTAEQELVRIETELMDEALKLPNNTHPDVPVGSQNKVVFSKRTDSQEEAATKGLSHLEIAQNFDLVDFERATKVTGSKFAILKREAVLLEQALVRWSMDRAISKGFVPVALPDIGQTSILEACGFQPRDESSQVYHITHTEPELSLLGTSEAAIAGMHAN